MKKIFLLAAAFLGLAACSEDKIEIYHGPAFTQMFVMVPNAWTPGTFIPDSVAAFDFIKDSTKAVDTVRMQIAVSGVKSNADRTLFLNYSGDFNPQAQPEFPGQAVIPAGEVSVDLKFLIHRPLKEDEGRENSVRITFADQDGFTRGPNRTARLEFGTTPSVWPTEWGWCADFFLGTASKVKWRIIHHLFGTYDVKVTMSWGMFDMDTQNNFVKPLQEFVAKYNDESIQMERNFGPVPLKDENGVEITVGM